MKIAIDLGHGARPRDTGAIGVSIDDKEQISEEIEVRRISPFVSERLKELGHEVKIISITQASSVTQSLSARCEASNEWDADLFVSMHLNANQETDDPMGCEVFGISKKAVGIATLVEKAITGLGFKSRGVKNKDYYVLTHTNAPAILIESFFVDSIADVLLYQKVGAKALGYAIANGIHHGLTGKPATAPATPAAPAKEPVQAATPAEPKAPSLKVIDILGRCDTGLARELSLQVIAKVNRMVKSPILVEVEHPLIDISSSAVNPWLQPAAFKMLVSAVEKRDSRMKINSCYRTAIQQHILRQQLERGLCGLTAVALPGKSNHEKGLAIDIEDAAGWKPYLEDCGWSWIGAFDPMHFDYWSGINDLGRIGVSACQLLHNAHNKEQLAVDGAYGARTAAAINNFPINGW